MKVRTKWYGKQIAKHVDEEALKRLTKSAIIVQGEIKEVITEKGLIKTNLYRGSITYEIQDDKLTARVGSPIGDLANPKKNPPYPLYLELGTSQGIPPHRPMQTGLNNSRGRIKERLNCFNSRKTLLHSKIR